MDLSRRMAMMIIILATNAMDMTRINTMNHDNVNRSADMNYIFRKKRRLNLKIEKEM